MTDPSVAAFRDGLGPVQRATVDALRRLISASAEGLEEGFKWNAPSFVHQGEHRITLGLDRSGAVRVVLHRDAKPKDVAGFRFDDPDGLAHWPAADRGVLRFTGSAEVEAKAAALRALFARWIAATS